MEKMINSITLKHYRGFRDEYTLRLADVNNITYLVGPNNTGKSLITRMFSIFNKNLDVSQRNIFEIEHFSDNDFHSLDVTQPIQICFNINSQVFAGRIEPELVKLLKEPVINLCIEIRKQKDTFLACVFISNDEESSHNFNKVQKRFEFKGTNTLSSSLGMDQNQTENLCKHLFLEIKNRILVFDSIRAFDRSYSDFYKNGSGLVKWLYEKQSPSDLTGAKRQVREWLKEYFSLDVPEHVRADDEKKRLIFTFEQMDFSSEEVGTGYTMLYILLMEIVRNKKDIIVIDEIESHLQPGLIRILIKLIREYSSSQYIIATHSSTVMESAGVNDILYRFNKKDGVCKFEDFFRGYLGEQANVFREVCNELGVIPGDALLCNSVLWVEGPSEIFWLRAMLKNYFNIYKKKYGISCNLIEGLHYTILMTGGSNIVHYSFQEGEIDLMNVDEDYLLKVLKVNPNPFVIIDSDNASPHSAKAQRMLKIAQELNKVNKLNPKTEVHYLEDVSFDNIHSLNNMWILKGKELENYVHPQLLKEFYIQRSEKPASNIKGADACTDWNVFSTDTGAGAILESRGISNVAQKSGTLIHKNDLCRFVFNKLQPIHFEEAPSEDMCIPNSEMLNDLISNLEKIISYIIMINDLE